MRDLKVYFSRFANNNYDRDREMMENGIIVVDDISPFEDMQGPFWFATPFIRLF
jgi:hypothetical protein